MHLFHKSNRVAIATLQLQILLGNFTAVYCNIRYHRLAITLHNKQIGKRGHNVPVNRKYPTFLFYLTIVTVSL